MFLHISGKKTYLMMISGLRVVLFSPEKVTRSKSYRPAVSMLNVH